MKHRFRFRSLEGEVTSFDVSAGAGEVTATETRELFPFHCTQVDGGARSIPLQTPVAFNVVAGLPGRWEAANVAARTGAFLCPVCGAAVAGEVGAYDVCNVCNWEDDPVQREDAEFPDGANQVSLSQARTTWVRSQIQAVTGEVASQERG